MNTPTFTVLRTTRTAVEADLLIATLRSAGLHPVDLKTSPLFSFAGCDISYPIEVPTAELSEARELLESYEKQSHAT